MPIETEYCYFHFHQNSFGKHHKYSRFRLLSPKKTLGTVLKINCFLIGKMKNFEEKIQLKSFKYFTHSYFS